MNDNNKPPDEVAASSSEFDHLAGLNWDAPEVLVRDARRMQAKAESYLKPEFAELFIGQTPAPDALNILFQVATYAANNPNQVDAAKVVRSWSEWWDRSHPRIQYDTRSDAQRFLVYIVDRREGIIETMPEASRIELLLAAKL